MSKQGTFIGEDTPIYSRIVSFEVHHGEHRDHRRIYQVISESCDKHEVGIIADAQYIRIPRKDIPLLIGALTNFVNLK